MNNDRQKKKSGGSVVGFVIALAITLFGSIDSGAAPALALIIIVVAGVGIALAVAASKAKKAGSGSDGNRTESSHTRREFTPEHFDMGKLIKQNRGSLSKLLTEKMREDFSDCDDDHEHAEPDIHADPEEKRAAQLREMLKNGIIEKEEYNILMRKYGLK